MTPLTEVFKIRKLNLLAEYPRPGRKELQWKNQGHSEGFQEWLAETPEGFQFGINWSPPPTWYRGEEDPSYVGSSKELDHRDLPPDHGDDDFKDLPADIAKASKSSHDIDHDLKFRWAAWVKKKKTDIHSMGSKSFTSKKEAEEWCNEIYDKLLFTREHQPPASTKPKKIFKNSIERSPRMIEVFEPKYFPAKK